MQRLIGAFCVIALIATIGTSGFLINTNTAGSVKSKIEKSVKFADNGENKKAKKELDGAINEWNKNIEIMLMFESHGKLDEIEETINIAQSYINKKEYNMFYAECNHAVTLLEHFQNLEYPNITNIL